MQKKENTCKKGSCLVGISGGVDSAFCAHTLQKNGYDVVGVFLKPWQSEQNVCSWSDDYQSAMRVCAHLQIPFVFRDYSDVFQKKIINTMIEGYKNGDTPNPDILCNKDIKFTFFETIRSELGLDFVATGHYVSKREDKNGWSLFQAKDNTKDQSYFLWAVERKLLDKVLFPLGGYEKAQVRKMAKAAGIPSAERQDSTGLCFVGDINFSEFLGKYIEKKPGNILNEEGAKVGVHQGASFFTIGQRHGFELTVKEEGTSYVVVGKDTKNNTITVAAKGETSSFGVKCVDLTQENYFSPPTKKAFARIRHLGELYKVEYSDSKVYFEEEVLLAQGQSLVLYDQNGMCFGGGIIKVCKSL